MSSIPPTDFEPHSASERPRRRPRWKKVLACAAIGLLLLILTAYLAGNYALTHVSKRILESVSARAKTQDIEITKAGFRKVYLSSWRSATWRDLAAHVQFTKNAPSQGSQDLVLNADTMIVRMTGRRRIAVEARDFTATAGIPVEADEVAETDQDAETSPPEDNSEGEAGRRMTRSRVKGRHLQIELEVDPFHPWPDLDKILPELIALTTTGTTKLPIQIEGKVFFPVKGKEEATRFSIEHVDDLYALRLSTVDLDFISDRFQEELTAAEVQFVAENPFRAPNLLRIKDQAETRANTAFQRDDTVPEDAYRHILWSYLLTTAYGEEFAKTVTDAHEEGFTGNTKAERQMDYRNNEVGRRYAVTGVRQKSILKRLRDDPDVVLKAP